MKKIILLFTAILLLVSSARTQNTEYAFIRYLHWGYYGYTYTSKESKEKLAKAGVSGYTSTSVKEKDKYVSAVITYDKNGNTSSCQNYNKKGKIGSFYIYEYNSDNLMVSELCKNSKGKEIQKLTVTYDQLKNTIEESYIKKGELTAKTVSKYDSTRLLESSYYKKGKPDYSKKWVYSYYPDKTRKSSVIYDAKGKVLYTWNYECKPEGELQSKHKDTTDVCKKIDYDSAGNKTITLRKFDEKGKAYKVVSVYDKNDKMIQYLSYNTKDQLDYSYKYTPGAQNIGESVTYKKGKENYRYLYSYDDNNNLISTFGYHKGEQINHSEYKYNEQNLVVSYLWYTKKDKLFETTTYEYKFF
jgi:hypothetical protein